jgi:hypothetical protein
LKLYLKNFLGLLCLLISFNALSADVASNWDHITDCNSLTDEIPRLDMRLRSKSPEVITDLKRVFTKNPNLINCYNDDGETPLYWSITRITEGGPFVDFAHFLLDFQNIEVDRPHRDTKGTPLFELVKLADNFFNASSVHHAWAAGRVQQQSGKKEKQLRSQLQGVLNSLVRTGANPNYTHRHGSYYGQTVRGLATSAGLSIPRVGSKATTTVTPTGRGASSRTGRGGRR